MALARPRPAELAEPGGLPDRPWGRQQTVRPPPFSGPSRVPSRERPTGGPWGSLPTLTLCVWGTNGASPWATGTAWCWERRGEPAARLFGGEARGHAGTPGRSGGECRPECVPGRGAGGAAGGRAETQTLLLQGPEALGGGPAPAGEAFPSHVLEPSALVFACARIRVYSGPGDFYPGFP